MNIKLMAFKWCLELEALFRPLSAHPFLQHTNPATLAGFQDDLTRALEQAQKLNKGFLDIIAPLTHPYKPLLHGALFDVNNVLYAVNSCAFLLTEYESVPGQEPGKLGSRSAESVDLLRRLLPELFVVLAEIHQRIDREISS